jgi:DNA polymerase III subunit gamma/tau
VENLTTQPTAVESAGTAHLAGSYVVSARKYRPDTFESVVGQQAVVGTLRNALKLGQVAHAYLFCGPRGVGKTTCARILAKAVNCKNLGTEGDPCNECDSCRAFNENRSLNIFEQDAASNNSVDDIRALIEQLRYVPQNGSRNIYIIDEVHMLSTAAFNAFLKTLEEPPAHALFILATTEKHKLPATILSRCQKFDFRRIGVYEIAEHLSSIAKNEHITYELDALQLIAIKADGGMRDALSIFDQMVNFGRRNVTYRNVVENLAILDYEDYLNLTEEILKQDHSATLLRLQKILEAGHDTANFMTGLVEHFRNLLVARETRSAELLELSDEVRNRYLSLSARIDPGLLLAGFQMASDAESRYRTVANPRLLVELTLVKLCHLPDVLNLAEQAEVPKK